LFVWGKSVNTQQSNNNNKNSNSSVDREEPEGWTNNAAGGNWGEYNMNELLWKDWCISRIYGLVKEYEGDWVGFNGYGID
jgi:hypothetical protein